MSGGEWEPGDGPHPDHEVEAVLEQVRADLQRALEPYVFGAAPLERVRRVVARHYGDRDPA